MNLISLAFSIKTNLNFSHLLQVLDNVAKWQDRNQKRMLSCLQNIRVAYDKYFLGVRTIQLVFSQRMACLHKVDRLTR